MTYQTSWPLFAGLITLLAGGWTVRRELSSASGLAFWIALGPAFTAAALAAFGVEHLTAADSIMRVVPRWMPAPYFWTYLVGIALIAVACSWTFSVYVRLSATLLGIMLICFVARIHLPGAIRTPTSRVIWAVAVRDLSFGAGALIDASGASRPNKTEPAAKCSNLAAVCIS